jgi:signal transduction histidine kinase
MPQKRVNSASLFWRYLPLGATYVLALGILGGTILYAAHDLRTKSRHQIVVQHARILYALWLSQKFSDDPEALPSTEEKPSDQLPALLQTAGLQQLQLAGLMGTRLFDPNGNFVFADPNITDATLTSRDLAELHRLNPVAHLYGSADLNQFMLVLPEDSAGTGAVLEVSIPLHSPGHARLVGIAQFLLDGTNLVAEFRTLDANLVRQAWLTFLAGGGLLGVVLVLGFHQLQRVNRLLTERTRRLLEANQELTLAAKTSAVGAVTAHLIHGLKNPLSGLQTFVTSRAGEAGDDANTEWALAVSSTRRMQAMIGEIVRVLRDEEVESQYEISLEEFLQILQGKVQPLARDAGVRFETHLNTAGILQNREANLISLILYNLVQNAIQATPKGKLVSISFSPRGQRISCEVRDEGPGLSESQRASLFKPCRSTKQGGSGIGLAICKQLANCLGAELELGDTGPKGSSFVLVFDASSGRQELPLPAGRAAAILNANE